MHEVFYMSAAAAKLKFGRTIDFIALFVLLPAILSMRWLPIPVVPLLLVLAIGCGAVLHYSGFVRRDWFKWHVARAEVWRVLLTFAIAAPVLLLVGWWLRPDALFLFPRERTLLWLLVMVLYPLLSVYPQEIIFRAFFFQRYRVLFGNGAGIVIAGAAAFAWAHIIFLNWVAILLTFCGGLLFAFTYRRTKALLFVAAEHALYGCFVFTVGFGHYLVYGLVNLNS